MNEELNKALMIIVKIQHEYPAIYRAFELDKVAQHILDSQGPINIVTPFFIDQMSEEEKTRIVASNPMFSFGTSDAVTITNSPKDEDK